MTNDEKPPGRAEPPTIYSPGRPAGTFPPTPPSAAQGQVEIGAILNHIYEVKRLIARGGMGEVFEGVNVNDDNDRVAIKVMLPALAADPKVQAMFRKEASILTRLSHPAVVQYRVLAQEPSLGVFYIVTEFLDGESLAEWVGRKTPTSPELRALLRRLAEGLKTAHDLGAVHRDISPDNVLLPDGRLDRAKIIDFGIAKDLDTTKATIVGDGFAGKLGYVAPEQLGAFGRDVGPWSDVYSLGLVILTLAAGHNLDMGATLVDAVDRRRAEPDLSVAPPDLRGVLGRMLVADPAQRARSMDEVLAMLDGAESKAPPPPAAIPTKRSPRPNAIGHTSGARRAALGAAVGGAASLIIGLLVLLISTRKPPAAAPVVAAAPGPAINADAARRAIQTALANVSCSWLDVVSATPSGSGVAIKLAGVAASTNKATTAVSQAGRAAGANIGDVDAVDVLAVAAPVCEPLDAFRAIRADTSVTGPRISTSQTTYTLESHPNGVFQKAVITMSISNPSLDFALFGLLPDGAIGTLGNSRQAILGNRAARAQGAILDLENDRYRLSIVTDHVGLSGLLLLTGRGPFDAKLIAPPPAKRGPDWARRIQAAAQAGGWQAEMAWYRTVGP